MRKNILYLIDSLNAGGAERMLYSTLKHLDRRRFDAVVCPLFKKPDHWKRPIEELGYPVICPALRGRWDWKRGLIGVRHLVEKTVIDLIHAQLYSANLYGRFLAHHRRLPIITSLQSPDYEPEVLEGNPAIGPVKLSILRMIDRWTGSRYGHRWIAVSDFVRQSARRRLALPEDRISLIYNGIDLEVFKPISPEERKATRLSLGCGPDDPILLSVGRLHPHKGHRFLLKAFTLVAARYPRVKLLLAGTGSAGYTSELQSIVQSPVLDGRASLLGVRRDVPQLLAACDVFVFPSLYEGLSLALAEALAAERACVASAIQPNREVVEDGVTGLLIDPSDWNGFAEALCSLLAHPAQREAMGKAGRRKVLLNFDVAASTKQMENLYETTLVEWIHSR